MPLVIKNVNDSRKLQLRDKKNVTHVHVLGTVDLDPALRVEKYMSFNTYF